MTLNKGRRRSIGKDLHQASQGTLEVQMRKNFVDLGLVSYLLISTIYLPFPRPVARIDFGGWGAPKKWTFWITKVDLLNLTPLTLLQKPNFWPILWLKVDLSANLEGCIAPLHPLAMVLPLSTYLACQFCYSFLFSIFHVFDILNMIHGYCSAPSHEKSTLFTRFCGTVEAC